MMSKLIGADVQLLVTELNDLLTVIKDHGDGIRSACDLSFKEMVIARLILIRKIMCVPGEAAFLFLCVGENRQFGDREGGRLRDGVNESEEMRGQSLDRFTLEERGVEYKGSDELVLRLVEIKGEIMFYGDLCLRQAMEGEAGQGGFVFRCLFELEFDFKKRAT